VEDGAAHRREEATVVATAELLLVATHLLPAERTEAAAAVVVMVEATAIHLAPAATPGGKSIPPNPRRRQLETASPRSSTLWHSS
jgi:hypothetical protein